MSTNATVGNRADREGVVVIGDALIDEIAGAGEAASVDIVGGAGLNVAVGLRRLGAPSSLLAMIGDDADGTRILTYLAAHDVPVSPSPSPHGSSRATSTRNASGEPEYRFNQAARNRALSFDTSARSAISTAEVVVVTCYPFDDLDQSQRLLSTVEQSPAVYVLDPNPRSGMIGDRDRFISQFERHVAAAWLVKISDEDADYLYGTSARDSVERLLTLGASAVLATYGSEGAEVFLAGSSHRVRIAELPGDIVDTMGAGDATIATVVAEAVRHGFDLDSAAWDATLAQAMRNAAATCRRTGALLRTTV